MMKSVFMRVLLTILGIILIALVLTFEIDGSAGFLMATFGVFFIIIGLTLRRIIELFL